MKKTLLSTAVGALLFLASCSPQMEYTNALPSHVTSLASIDLASLADKAGIQDKENEAYIQRFKAALKTEMSSAAFQQMETILNDPSASGVDVTAPLYIFTGEGLSQGALLAKVSDEEELRSLIATLQSEGANVESSEAEGCSIIQVNREILLAYNASALFAVNCQRLGQAALASLQDSLSVWMRQGEEQSFAAKPEFKQMQEQTGDIKAIYSYANLPVNYMAITGYRMPAGTDMNTLKDLKLIAGLAFEKGSIDAHFTPYTENEQLKALIQKQDKASLPVRNTFIEYFPQSTLMLLSLGMDGEAFYDVLMETTPLGENLSANDAAHIRQLLGMFKEDFTLGLVNLTLNNLPSLLVYASVEDAAPLKELPGNADLQKLLGRGNEIIQLEEDSYVWRSRNFNFFFGVRNKQFYATNDETLYHSLFKPCDPSAKENDYAAGMKGKKAACIINAEAICQLPIVKMLAGLGGPKYAAAFAALDKVSYLKSESNGTAGTFSLQLKDKNTNALKQIVDLTKSAL